MTIKEMSLKSIQAGMELLLQKLSSNAKEMKGEEFEAFANGIYTLVKVYHDAPVVFMKAE